MRVQKSLSPIAFHCKLSFANALQETSSFNGKIEIVFLLVVGITVANMVSG